MLPKATSITKKCLVLADTLLNSAVVILGLSLSDSAAAAGACLSISDAAYSCCFMSKSSKYFGGTCRAKMCAGQSISQCMLLVRALSRTGKQQAKHDQHEVPE